MRGFLSRHRPYLMVITGVVITTHVVGCTGMGAGTAAAPIRPGTQGAGEAAAAVVAAQLMEMGYERDAAFAATSCFSDEELAGLAANPRLVRAAGQRSSEEENDDSGADALLLLLLVLLLLATSAEGASKPSPPPQTWTPPPAQPRVIERTVIKRECKECGGTGYQPCPDCRGTGKVEVMGDWGPINKTCPTCNGKGHSGRKCINCGGTGYVSE